MAEEIPAGSIRVYPDPLTKGNLTYDPDVKGPDDKDNKSNIDAEKMGDREEADRNGPADTSIHHAEDVY